MLHGACQVGDLRNTLLYMEMPDTGDRRHCPRTATGHPTGRRTALEVARLLRRVLEVVVAAVDVVDPRGDQLGGLDGVQAGDVDCVERVAARFLRKRAQSEALAEPVPDRRAAELVLGELRLAREQAERIALHGREPVAALAAHRAVALDRALGEVDVGLEADGAAVTASLVGLLHGFGSSARASERSLL